MASGKAEAMTRSKDRTLNRPTKSFDYNGKMVDVEPEAEREGASFSLEEINRHKNEGDTWVIHAGKVYDISDFVERHPGGKDILLKNSGKDITRMMTEDHVHKHSKIAYGWLHKYYIGEVKEKVRGVCAVLFH